MKKSSAAAAAFLLLLVLPSLAQQAARPSILVLPMANATGVESYRAACSAATETLALTLGGPLRRPLSML